MELDLQTNVGHTERLASTVAGGALLAMALGRNNWASLPIGLLGGMLVMRGATGHCEMYKQLGISSSEDGSRLSLAQRPGLLTGTVKVQKTVTINRPPHEIYSFWRKFSNLPQFCDNLISVTEIEPGVSHWIAHAPGADKIEWTAQIDQDIPNERISWHTLEGSAINHNGSVSFYPATNGRGTEVRVVCRYASPGGKLGQAYALFMGNEPGMQISADLRRLKQLLETGEVATTQGQPAGAGRITTGQRSTNHALLDV